MLKSTVIYKAGNVFTFILHNIFIHTYTYICILYTLIILFCEHCLLCKWWLTSMIRKKRVSSCCKYLWKIFTYWTLVLLKIIQFTMTNLIIKALIMFLKKIYFYNLYKLSILYKSIYNVFVPIVHIYSSEHAVSKIICVFTGFA